MKLKLLVTAAAAVIISTLNAQVYTRANLITPYTDLANPFRSTVADNSGNIYYGSANNKFGKMDSTGTEFFQKTFPALGILSYLSFTDLALDGSGNIVACGTMKQGFMNGTDSVKTFGPAGNSATTDGFVAKLNGSNGAVIWFKTLGGVGDDAASALHVDGAGNIYVTGNTSTSPVLQFDTASRVGSSYEMFVAKFNSSGTITWLQQCNSVNGDFVRASGSHISADAFGNVYVAGNLDGKGKFGSSVLTVYQNSYVAKYSATGTYQWVKNFETGGAGVLRAMCADAAGNTYLAGFGGNFGGTTAGMPIPGGKHFLIKVNADSTWGWKRLMSINVTTPVFQLKANTLNEIYFTGIYGADLILNSGVTDSVKLSPGTASTSIFLAKYNAAGDLKSALTTKPVTMLSVCSVLDMYITPAGKGYLMTTVTGNTVFSPTLTVPGSGYLNPVVLFEAGGVVTTGLKETADATAFEYYPNPSSGQVTIKASFDGTLAIMDMSGKMVLAQEVVNNATVQVNDLSAGVYLIRLQSEAGAVTRKLIVH